MTGTAPVSAIIPIKSPRRDHLARTVASLANLNPPPEEVIFVDSTPGGFKIGGKMEGCSSCGGPVENALESLKSRDVHVDVIEDESLGIGGARLAGMLSSSNPYVWHLDEDAVILTSDWVDTCLETLQQDGVSAVTGVVASSVDGNPTGEIIARLERTTNAPLTGHYLMHHKSHCTADGSCFFMDQNRGEDITLRRDLRRAGRVVRDPSLEAQKALPTTRQSIARDVVLSVTGGVVATVTGIALRRGWQRLKSGAG